MAIQIKESITTREGTILSSFYIRLETLEYRSGKALRIECYHYASSESYLSGYDPIITNKVYDFPYNSSLNGTDTKRYSHDCLVSKLTTSQGKILNDRDELEDIPPERAAKNVSIVDL